MLSLARNVGLRMGDYDRALLVGSTFNACVDNTTQALSLPAGAAVGDLCYAAAMYNNPNTPTGFTMLSNWALSSQSGQYMRHGYKVLTAGDISSPPTWVIPNGLGGCGLALAVFRGPKSVASKGFTEDVGGGTTAAHSGYAKAGNHLGAVAVAIDRDNVATWAVAAPFQKLGIAGSGIYGIGLGFAPNGYNGESASWSAFGTSTTNVAGLLELLA